MDSRRWQEIVPRRSRASRTNEQSDIPESYHLPFDLEDGVDTARKQLGMFSWLRPTRRREMQFLDDELFQEAKTSQLQSEWPSLVSASPDSSMPRVPIHF